VTGIGQGWFSGTLNPQTVSTQLSNSLTQPYSLTSVFTINLSSNGYASLQGTTAIATPEPGGLVLALASIPVLGVGAWVGRRRALA
jgi:hypothetical protein